jgi:hypothetical protein
LTAKKSAIPRLLGEMVTGILGFDEISRADCLGTGRAWVMGGLGTGKTVFALQALVNAARERKQPGTLRLNAVCGRLCDSFRPGLLRMYSGRTDVNNREEHRASGVACHGERGHQCISR